MSIFKCKMCGGSLEVHPDETVATCEYCGTKQTLPRLDDDRRANMYDRANHFRRINDFDKAAGIYDQILNEDSTDAEAYWSLVLCRYGIEYVEDPATHRRLPTINRAQFTSVFDDVDYKAALQYADPIQRVVYEDEANAINEIQKGILSISQKESPFDVFICYKETDANGRRTPDSVLANDLYHQLTQEGLKVFFSRITLEDKLGTAYEPYIFAALNSAKVMVVLGTRPEYFNAVWVKNEWSRYLALIRNGAKKILVPAYKDMDPYDLPDEFAHLQAQDMSKLGFMQDLLRGIKKLIQPVAAQGGVGTSAPDNLTNTNVTAWLERAFIFLEDGNWSEADAYCEKVLDQVPKCAEAYLGKLMVELKVNRREDLGDLEEDFSENDNFSKTIRFAEEPLKSELNNAIKKIQIRNENERLEKTYSDAIAALERAKTEYNYRDLSEIFSSILNYKDSREREHFCLKNAERIKSEREEKKKIERLKQEKRKQEIQKHLKMLLLTASIIALCLIGINTYVKVIVPNVEYNKAMSLFEMGQYNEAYSAFVMLGNFKDSQALANQIILEQPQIYFAQLDVGDYALYGSYEQDDDFSNGQEPIEWIILEKQENKVLLLSKYVLEWKPYNMEYDSVTWETCSIREWLNNEFINTAFSDAEQDLIATESILTIRNPAYKQSEPAYTTEDRLFLLSVNEASLYAEHVNLICIPTVYAMAQEGHTTRSGVAFLWWLRTCGHKADCAACITNDGSISYYGLSTTLGGGVRPAMWLDLN